MCYPLAGTTDQYFGKSQVATNVSIRSSNLKTIMEMQNASHGGLSHSGCHLESSVKNNNSLVFKYNCKTGNERKQCFQWYLPMTLSRSAFSGERKKVNISTLIILKQFDSNQNVMKCDHDNGLINTADVSSQEEAKTCWLWESPAVTLRTLLRSGLSHFFDVYRQWLV